jgi:hypothetical protein
MEEFGFTADDLEWVHQRMAHHRGNSAQSIDEYVRAQCIQLAATVMRRRRVYLDTCYWIRLRDADLGRNVAIRDERLLAALRSHVRDGRLLCPISDATFYEVHKQSDDSTRGATAALIDELSTGVAIRTQRDRMATELARTLHRRAGLDTLDSSALAWVPVSTVLGEQHPVTAAFPADVQLALQKGFYDLMSRIRLADMTRLTGKMPRDEHRSDQIARDLHAANQQHAGVHATFEMLRLAELDGGIDLFVDDAMSMLRVIAARSEGRIPLLNKDRQSADVVARILRALVRIEEFSHDCLSLYVKATCYAAVRWDQRRVFRANDMMDFNHASAALPYCDGFFTESPLRALIQQRHTRLSELFPCAVFSDSTLAVEWIESAPAAA